MQLKKLALSMKISCLVCVSLLFIILGFKLIPMMFSVEIVETIIHIAFILLAVLLMHILDKMYYLSDLQEINIKSIKKVMQEQYELLNDTKKTGIEKIYPNRNAAIDDIRKAIEFAQNRVWFLGIAFSSQLKMKDFLYKVHKKSEELNEFNYRILVMDALRSPAVFRSFLESEEERVKEMVDPIHNSGNMYLHPYRSTRMFQDFSVTWDLLRKPVYQKRVKYYAHNPNCWMVIADDVIFYQPYTFGKSSAGADNSACIGSLMPVFKIPASFKGDIYEILEDHYQKLWYSTAIEVSIVTSRFACQDKIISSIFGRRRAWLRFVYTSLYRQSGENEKRNTPRLCIDQIPCILSTETNNDYDVFLTNYSQGGVQLELLEDCPIKENHEFTLSLSDDYSCIHEREFGNLFSTYFRVVYRKDDLSGATYLGAKFENITRDETM